MRSISLNSMEWVVPGRAKRLVSERRWLVAWPESGFTLVELLTVVAVIGILTSLLLPTLGRAKQSARQVQCASNLRQLALAGQMYWDDNSGKAFRWRGAALNDGQIYWFGWLQNGQEGERRFDPSFGALYPYLGGKGVEVCGAFNYFHPQFKRKARVTSFGYGYNLILSSRADEPPVDLGKVKHPDAAVFLADSAQVNTFQAPASADHPMLEEFYYVNESEATAHFRHHSQANVAFCDGHVGAERPAPGGLDRRLPGETIGRLRSEILRLE